MILINPSAVGFEEAGFRIQSFTARILRKNENNKNPEPEMSSSIAVAVRRI